MTPRSVFRPALFCLLSVASLVPAFTDTAILPPASHVMWIDKLVGPASFSPVGATGEDAWVPAKANLVVAEGASIFTQNPNQDQAIEVELRWGGGALRIAADTSITLQRHDEEAMLVVLHQGILNVSLDAKEANRKFEVGTTNAGLEMTAAGQYHFETDAQGNANRIRVDAGQIVVNRPFGQTVIGSGQTAQLEGDTLRLDPLQQQTNAAYQPEPSPQGDGLNAAQPSYNNGFYGRDADPGSDQLAAYGEWAALPSGQQAWYPAVGSDWAPNTDGRWQWVDPGGWTWIDNSAWGFTPSHYGRWGYAGRWYWVPGPAVYSPAVVAWVGTPGMVAWVPLAPGESVNGILPVSRFANHEHITVIPQQAFVSAAPVSAVRMQFPRGFLDRTYVSGFVQVRPERLSILGSSVRAPQPPIASLQRSYFSSVQAAPVPLALEARLQAYRASPAAGRPLGGAALRSTANDPAARSVAGAYAPRGYARPAAGPGGGSVQPRPGFPALLRPGGNNPAPRITAPQPRPQSQPHPHSAPHPQAPPAPAKHR